MIANQAKKGETNIQAKEKAGENAQTLELIWFLEQEKALECKAENRKVAKEAIPQEPW